MVLLALVGAFLSALGAARVYDITLGRRLVSGTWFSICIESVFGILGSMVPLYLHYGRVI